MALNKEQERLCRELGNKQALSGSLNDQALILDVRGDLDGAMALHKEKERLCRDLRSAASQIEEFAPHWQAAHEAGCRTKEARRKIAEEARNPVRQMLQLALEGRVTADRKRKSFPFAAEAPGFLRYLQEERGLRPATIYHYIHRLHGFGEYLRRLSVTSLAELSPALLASFVVEAAPKLARTSRRDLCGILRAFLRFCHRERVPRLTRNFPARQLPFSQTHTRNILLPRCISTAASPRYLLLCVVRPLKSIAPEK